MVFAPTQNTPSAAIAAQAPALSSHLTGFALVNRLRSEAEEVAMVERSELMQRAANEIEGLIVEAKRKCRAEFVRVLELFKDGKPTTEPAYTQAHGPRTEYPVGKIVCPDKWCEDWTNECSNGIHFFITRLEAEAYE